MAQTKRKRKHRGNAAGMIEARGRTGRPLTAEEAGQKAKLDRADRFNRPPTWRSSMNRAAFATVIFVAALVLILKSPLVSTVTLAFAVFAIYVPLGYYTDQFIYNRRQAKLLQQRSQPKGGR